MYIQPYCSPHEERKPSSKSNVEANATGGEVELINTLVY